MSVPNSNRVSIMHSMLILTMLHSLVSREDDIRSVDYLPAPKGNGTIVSLTVAQRSLTKFDAAICRHMAAYFTRLLGRPVTIQVNPSRPRGTRRMVTSTIEVDK